MKRVIVFGESGFTGFHFREYASLQEDFSFIGVIKSIDGHKCSSMERENWESVTGDVSVPGVVERLIDEIRPDYILNLVGSYATEKFDELVEINTYLSQRILNACKNPDWPLQKIVLIGSAAEYGVPSRLPISEDHPLEPVSEYGLSKLLQTEIAAYYWRVHKVPVCIARTFNLLGRGLPSTLSIGSFVKQILDAPDNGAVKVGNLASRRDFVNVTDAVRAYWIMLTSGTPGEIYNVCSGQSYLIRDILSALISASGKRLDFIETSDLIRPNDVEDIYGSFKKLNTDTGWAPKANLLGDEGMLKGLFGN